MSLKLANKSNYRPKQFFAEMLRPESKVLDIGCWNYTFKRYCDELNINGLKHYGVDRETPEEAIPDNYTFVKTELNEGAIPFEDESFDAIIASHVIEHVDDQLSLMREIFRLLKVGGLVYIECPSVRSLWLPSMPFKFEEFRSLNYYDDPTHLSRPHSPQSLYRLFRMYEGEVLKCEIIDSKNLRWKFPYLLSKAWLKRDAAMLEDIVWKTFGFAVYGIARKQKNAERRYVLSR